MKYELSQQQYVDFLNSLTQDQATPRCPSNNLHRFTITGSAVGSYATSNPYVPCNYLHWYDVTAFLDRSGLRPMTELEFEKACRGTAGAVANEYAWGTTTVTGTGYTYNNYGATNEVIASNYSTTAGNAAYDVTVGDGPLRGGIFAATSGNSGRITSGASFYGIMELSGNLYEHIVSVGDPSGRVYTGVHGNGSITAAGMADVTNWPLGVNIAGTGFRGGQFAVGNTELPVSDRSLAAYNRAIRTATYGGRGVRTAP